MKLKPPTALLLFFAFSYKEYMVNDYILGCLNEENRYYIVAPKDIVVATLFDIEDRVQWLIEHRYVIAYIY